MSQAGLVLIMCTHVWQALHSNIQNCNGVVVKMVRLKFSHYLAFPFLFYLYLAHCTGNGIVEALLNIFDHIHVHVVDTTIFLLLRLDKI
jgi:hypothetical protein